MELRTYLFVVFMASLLSLRGQSEDFQEEVHVSVNTTNILVNETLQFSAFVYSNQTKNLSNLSSILYVELVDETGKAVHQTKIGLRNGRGSGSLYINPEWSSGTYRLVSYTRWMTNYESFSEQEVLIFNPYTGIRKNEKIGGSPLHLNEQIPVKLDTYTPLHTVSMNLGSMETASLSIAVQKTTDLYYDNAIVLENQSMSMSSFKVLPEYQYGLIQGMISNASGDLGGFRVMMTIKGASEQVSTTQTDEYGRFWMNYNPDLANEITMFQLQIEGDTVDDLAIVEEFHLTHSPLDQPSTSLDSLSIQTLINRSIDSQIQKAYEVSGYTAPGPEKVVLLRDAKVYYLDEYQRFPSIRDTFIEYIYYVNVSKSEDKYKMNVLCDEPPGLETTNKTPLLLLDGLKVAAEDIFNQSPNDIDRIEIIPNYYFLNDLVYKGVISVHSNGRKELDIPTTGKRFRLANYQSYSAEKYKMKIEETLPMYESCLFWDPIHSHMGGQLILNFKTSRLEGVYQVSVRGITASGLPINLVRYFQVKNSLE